jgi:dTDP-4-dehydrorhamnose reductase
MATVLITGGRGQLGSALVETLRIAWQVVAADLPEFDITDLPATMRGVKEVGPDIVIHCAAFADVDACETERDKAVLVNGLGARNVAIASREAGAKLVYISTDYVFDGTKIGEYDEYDTPNPKTVYGLSKLMGEVFVAQQIQAHFILRTAWLYGGAGRNFANTILHLARTKGELRVVNDQRGTPTLAADVARQVGLLMGTEAYGTYHCTSQGSCSWYEFACAILEDARVSARVLPVSTEEFPRPAPRPKNSVLDNLLLRIQGLDRMPPWRDSLSQFMAQTRCKEEEGA